MTKRESSEDYLETILLLSRKRSTVRSIDVAAELGYSKPSISIAMKKLRDRELITVDSDGVIRLTESGNALAEQVYERHSTLYEWLISIGVSENVAADDACKMEHILHDETFNRIKAQILSSETTMR